MRSTHSYTAFRWGHKWVVLAILVQFPFATRAWALPVLTALYHAPEKATKAQTPPAKRRRQKTKDQTRLQAKARAHRQAATQAQAQARAKTKAPKKKTKAQWRRQHKTPSELMRQLLLVLTHWFPDRRFVFAGDGGYGTHALARFAARRRRRKLTLVSLFYANAALHDPPPVVVGQKNGRPARRGTSGPPPRRWWPRPSHGNGWRCPGTAVAVAPSRWSAGRATGTSRGRVWSRCCGSTCTT